MRGAELTRKWETKCTPAARTEATQWGTMSGQRDYNLCLHTIAINDRARAASFLHGQKMQWRAMATPTPAEGGDGVRVWGAVGVHPTHTIASCYRDGCGSVGCDGMCVVIHRRSLTKERVVHFGLFAPSAEVTSPAIGHRATLYLVGRRPKKSFRAGSKMRTCSP